MNSNGPLFFGLGSAVVPAGLLAAMLAGMQIDLPHVLMVLIPGMTVAVLCVAVSMGWMFVMVGRWKQWPAALPLTIGALAVGMAEMVGLIIWLTRARGAWGAA